MEFRDGSGYRYTNRVPVYYSSTKLRYDIAVGTGIQNWIAYAVNSGKYSNSYSFYVRNPVKPAPKISSVSPSVLKPLSVSQRQWMTVYGQNFTKSSRLEFRDSRGTVYANRTPVYYSSTTLKYYISVGTSQQYWSVRVVDSGQYSNTYGFRVGYTSAVKLASAVSSSAKSYTVRVVKTGGSGTVTGTGISCGADCSGSYAQGAQLNLKAIPQSGFVFKGWLVNGQSVSGTYRVNANTTVTAIFQTR